MSPTIDEALADQLVGDLKGNGLTAAASSSYGSA
jgi:hypothetical protein